MGKYPTIPNGFRDGKNQITANFDNIGNDINNLQYSLNISNAEMSNIKNVLSISTSAAINDFTPGTNMILTMDVSGVLSARFKDSSVANAPILLDSTVTEISFEYLAKGKYVVLGGTNSLYTAVSIGNDSYFTRIVDFNGTAFTIIANNFTTGLTGANNGDIVKVSYFNNVYTFMIKRPTDTDFVNWFSIPKSSVNANGWKNNNRLGFARFAEVGSDLTVDQQMQKNINLYKPFGTNHTKQFSDISTKLFNYHSDYKKWAALGDSITKANGISKSYHQHAKERLNVPTVINYGISGTRIARMDVNDVDAMSIRYTSMDSDVDLITVFGGTNDFGTGTAPLGTFADRTPDTFYGACHVLMEGLINKYPTATIAFITPLQRNLNGTESKTIRGYTLKQFVDAIKECARYYAIPVLDLYETSNFYPDNSVVRTQLIPDGLHPNNSGHAKLGKRVASFLDRL